MAEQIRGKAVVRHLTPGRNASQVVLVEGGVVMRVANPTDATASTWVERAKAARGLEHPSLARMRGAKPADPTSGEPTFIANEFIDGPLLSEVAPALDGAEASRIARSLAGAVKVLHDAGVAHGRIYDRQVRLRANQTPVLLDVAATWGAEPTKAADVAGLVKLAVELPEGPDTPAWESLIGHATTIEEVLEALDTAPAPAPAVIAPPVLAAPVVAEQPVQRRVAPVVDLAAPDLPVEPAVVAAPAPLDPPAAPAPVEAFNPYEQSQEPAPWAFDPFASVDAPDEPTPPVHPSPAFETAPAPGTSPVDTTGSDVTQAFAAPVLVPPVSPLVPVDLDGPVPILQYDPVAGVSVDTTGTLAPSARVVDLTPEDSTPAAFDLAQLTPPGPAFVPVDEEPDTAPAAPDVPQQTDADEDAVAPVSAPAITDPEPQWQEVGSGVAAPEQALSPAEPAPAVVPVARAGERDVLAELAEAQATIQVLSGRLANATVPTLGPTGTDGEYEQLVNDLQRARQARDTLAEQVDELTSRLTDALDQASAANTALEAERAVSAAARADVERLTTQVNELAAHVTELTADVADAAAAHARANAAEAQVREAADQLAEALSAVAEARQDVAAVRAEVAVANEQIVPLTAQVADLTGKLVEANRARAAAEDAKAQFVAERAASVRQSLTAVEHTNDLEAQAARMASELEALRASSRTTRERADSAVAAAQERADAAIQAAETRAQVATEEVAALRRLTAELTTRLAARPAAPEVATDHAERDELRSQVAELQNQAVVAQGTIAELRRQLDAAVQAVQAAQAGAALTPAGPSMREQALAQEVGTLTDRIAQVTGERDVAREQLALLRANPDGASEGVEKLLAQIATLTRERDRAQAMYEDAESRALDLAVAHAHSTTRLRELEQQYPQIATPVVTPAPTVVAPVAVAPHQVGPTPIVPRVVLPSESIGADVVPGAAHSFVSGAGPTLASLLREIDPDSGPQS